LFALGPKKLQDGPGASLLKAVLQRSARIFDGQVLPPLRLVLDIVTVRERYTIKS
jgi:hypothetical protein